MQIGWKNKMRKREEIKSDVRHIRNVPPTNGLILEVMLDMRELLEDIKEGRRE